MADDLRTGMARAILATKLPAHVVDIFQRRGCDIWQEAIKEADAAIAHYTAHLESDATFQQRVGTWMRECFPHAACQDRLERRDRLVEETLELAQTLPAFTAERAHALVDYVFGRPVGVTEQEVGGVSVTLAALCEAEGIDQRHWAETELTRISAPETIAKIRAKQASKPVGSALPIAAQVAAMKGTGA